MKHEESKTQRDFVKWMRHQHKKVLMFAIPNGAMLSGSAKQRAMRWGILESEGALPGTADLFVAQPSGDSAGLFIEFKTKAGRQADTQKAFQASAEAAGYEYIICRSFDEAREATEKYFAK